MLEPRKSSLPAAQMTLRLSLALVIVTLLIALGAVLTVEVNKIRHATVQGPVPHYMSVLPNHLAPEGAYTL